MTITTFRYDGDEVTELTDRTDELTGPAGYSGVVSFAEDGRGELYFFDRQRNDIYKIVASAAVPEPQGVVLALVACFGVVVTWRRA